MARSVPEWVGATDDTPIPARVKDRVMQAFGGCCSECGVEFSGVIRPEFDHIVALVNGGENREGNIRAVCAACHVIKTKEDVSLKSVTYRKRSKHFGFEKKKRLIPGSKATRWKKTVSGEVFLRNRM